MGMKHAKMVQYFVQQLLRTVYMYVQFHKTETFSLEYY